jgi:hypothetical protein
MSRKALILIVLALTPAAALAAPSPTSVTLTADPPTVVTFGMTAKLSGMVSPAGHVKVQVTEQNCLKAPQQRTAATVTSTDTGAWTTTVTPTAKTVYQASAKSTDSPQVTIQVHPAMTLAKVSAHRYRVRITAGQSFGGKIALFQRAGLTRWKTIKSVVLRELGSGNGTVVSGKTFRSGIRHHRMVRVLLTKRQAGDCYLGAATNTLTS